MIIQTIKENEIPVTGFVIAGEISPANWKILKKFRDAGLGLGNHTLSHTNLNRVDPDAYIQEIEAADKILAPVLTEPKYFRYPYLAMSNGKKKNKVLRYLSAKNYQIAPITIDSKDFMFNQLLLAVPQNQRREFLKVLKPCYLSFIWQQALKAEEHSRYAHKTEQGQILLIHANLLNAYVLPDIIALFKQNGFNFVSLEKALNTPEQEATPTLLAQKDKKIESATANTNAAADGFMAWD